MKYFSLVLLLAIFSCSNNKSSTPDEKDSSLIRFNGIYSTDKLENENTGDAYRYFLRFYEDGTVISVTSSGTADQIANWFKKGQENVKESEYKLDDDDSISFTTSNANGKVKYKGTVVSRDKLKLHISSEVNDHEEDVTYKFVEEE